MHYTEPPADGAVNQYMLESAWLSTECFLDLLVEDLTVGESQE